MAKSQIVFKQLSLDSGEFEGTATGLVQIKDDAIVTGHITDSNVTLAKIANIASKKILGNNTAGAAAPAAAYDFQDDDTFASVSATGIASSESIKAYVDGRVNGLAWKEPVKAKVGSNVTMTANNLSSGVMIANAAGHLVTSGNPVADLVLNDRVLFTGQTQNQQKKEQHLLHHHWIDH